MDFSSRGHELMKRLKAANVVLVEWETSLFKTLGSDLVFNGDLFFLVPDDEIQLACDIAIGLGLRLADKTPLPARTSEHSDVAIQYILDEQPRHSFNNVPIKLVFIPMSWTGISRDDLIPILNIYEPYTIWTVPLSVTCTALVRIATRESHGSRLRFEALSDLGSVTTESLFDTSYEGDYMELIPDDQPWSEKEVLEMNNAVKEISSWNFKAEEEWMKQKMIDAITGKIRYYGTCWDHTEC